MNKIIPFLLAVWPYLFFPCVLLDSMTDSWEFLLIWIYCGLTPAVYILNIIHAWKEKEARRLAFWNLMLKLTHIPFYVAVFFIGAMLLGQLIAGNPFGLIIVPILAVIDYLLIITSSMYGISSLVKQKGRPLAGRLILGAMSLTTVLDVIAAVIIFIRVRKKVKN